MSNTDRHTAGLEKEISRLQKALEDAQTLNTKLEKDKDEAWALVQFIVKKQGGSYDIYRRELLQFDATRHQIQFRPGSTGTLTLTLTLKRKP